MPDIKEKLLIRLCLGIVAWIYLIFFMAAAQIAYQGVFFTMMGGVLAGYIVVQKSEILSFFHRPSLGAFRPTPILIFYVFIVGSILLFYYIIGLLPRICADAPRLSPLRPDPHHCRTRLLSYSLQADFQLAAEHGNALFGRSFHERLFSRSSCPFPDGNFDSGGAVFFRQESKRASCRNARCCVFPDERNGPLDSSYLFIPTWVSPFFFFLSFWYICKAMDDPPKETQYLLVAGIFAGAMAGCKLNAFIGGGILGFLFLSNRLLNKGFWRGLKHLLVYYVFPAAILLSPWLIKSAILTGNPVYPFCYNIFGGPEWDEALSGQMVSSHLNLGMGRTFVDYLLLPLSGHNEGGLAFFPLLRDHLQGMDRSYPDFRYIRTQALCLCAERCLSLFSIFMPGVLEPSKCGILFRS